MATTLESSARSLAGTTVRTRSGVLAPSRTSPTARPVRSRPSASPSAPRVTGRAAVAASCRIVSPTAARDALVLKIKVVAVAVVALVGVGVSAAEFSSWSEPNPAVDYVAGDPAWAHVSGR